MTKIAVGYATILGTIGAVAGVLIPFIGELADATDPLGVPPETWVILGAILAGVVVLGRMGQAIAAYLSGAGDGK
jgi:hypothetical protein